VGQLVGVGRKMRLVYWIVTSVIFVGLIAGYVALFLFARKRQKKFDEQYLAMKERKEVFVLGKKRVRERPKSKWMKFARFKTYQVTGRVTLSQAVRGIQVNRMQTVTFQTTKQEYEKIQVNHKYKMDIAGNYIGNVVAPPPVKGKKKKTDDKKKSVEASGKGKPAKQKNNKSK
jgi:hypothetical protein